MEIIAENFLEQMVNFPTRGTNILDLLAPNTPSLVNRCQTLPGLGDHDIVFIDSDITARRRKPTQRKIYLWKKANLKELRTAALYFQKEFVDKYSDTDSIQQMWTDIKTNIIKMIDIHVPTKMSTKRFNQPWITTEVKRKARQRKRSYNKARKTNNPKDHAKYRKIKDMSKKTCKKAYTEYINSIIGSDENNNSKRFWGFIKSKHCANTGVAPLKLQTYGIPHSDNKAKTNILNEQLSSVFNKNEDKDNITKKERVHTPQCRKSKFMKMVSSNY